MDEGDTHSSSGPDHEHLASIAGAFLSDNIRSVVKPFRQLLGRSRASQSRSVLHPLRQSLADASSPELSHRLHDGMDDSMSARESELKLVKHRLKPQVTLPSRSLTGPFSDDRLSSQGGPSRLSLRWPTARRAVLMTCTYLLCCFLAGSWEQ